MTKQDYNEFLIEQYSVNLMQRPEILEYVTKRGIPRSVIEEGRVGYCPPLAPHPFILLKGRITVPIRDAYGKFIAFAGRKWEPKEEELKPAAQKVVDSVFKSIREELSYKPSLAQKQIEQWTRAKWLNEQYHKKYHLFNLDRAKYAARETDFIYIVEGYFDALVLSLNGIENVVALCGAALTPYHAAKIKRYCSHVICLLDGDSAGEKGIAKALPTLKEAGLSTHAIFLPDGWDPDELVLDKGADRLNAFAEIMISTGRESANVKV